MAVPIERHGDNADNHAERGENGTRLVRAHLCCGDLPTFGHFVEKSLHSLGKIVAFDKAVAQMNNTPRVARNIQLVRDKHDGVPALDKDFRTAP